MNNMFQEYKKSFDIRCVSLSVGEKGIQGQALQEDDKIGIELPEEIKRGYIELEEERRWQRELFEINLEEIRGR